MKISAINKIDLDISLIFVYYSLFCSYQKNFKNNIF
jgi:hypothetical protein